MHGMTGSGFQPGSYESISDFENWAGLTVDVAGFNHLHDRLEAARSAEGGKEVRWAQDRILRASAFETGAVEDLYAEGATYSVAMEVDGWENDLADSGDGAEQHFEDQLAAYIAVRDLATETEVRPLLEVDVRELHRIATRSQASYPVQTPSGVQQQEFQSGLYKTKPNQVISRSGSVLQYAPVEDVAPEMERLISSMRTDRYAQAHPIIQSAYIHWAIAHIHPFADGNGRMARVIGSIPLLAHYGIPLVVFAGRKRLYLQALEAADRNNYQDMVDYIAARTMETYSWLCELVEAANATDAASDSLRDIAELIDIQSGRLETSAQAAERVREALFNLIQQEAAEKFQGTSIRHKVVWDQGYVTPKNLYTADRENHSYTITQGEVRVIVRVDEVARHLTTTSVQVAFSDALEYPPVRVLHDVNDDNLYFSLEDCSPDLSVGADLRLRNLSVAVVAWVTQKLKDDLAGIFKRHGRLPSKG